MATEFVAIEGKSKNYITTVVILGVITLIGFVCFASSYIQGHQVFGSSNTVPWGMPIVLAIYLIGLSAGSLILSSLTYVFGRVEYKPIARMAVFLAIALIFGALLSIAVDLGRPEKFWRLFMFFYLNNMTSMFAINGILYGGYFVISLVYLGIILSGQAKLSKIMGTIAVCWAVLVHMGTGAIFGFIAAREAWFSPIKPFEFLSAALVSGLALLIVIIVLTLRSTGRKVSEEMIVSLGNMLKAFIVLLFIFILIDKLTHVYSPHNEATLYMLFGESSWIFWILQIGLVVVLPLILLFNPRTNKRLKWILIAAISVVIGIFFERYFLVIPGAAFPQHYYPGVIEGVYGAIGKFRLTPAEFGFSIGTLTFLAFIFMFGLKYLELLPPKPPEEKPVETAPEEKPVDGATEEKPAESATAEQSVETTAEETAPNSSPDAAPASG